MKIRKPITLVASIALACSASIASADKGDKVEDYLDRKGDRIDHRLDRKGDRIDYRLDRKGDRVDSKRIQSPQRQVQARSNGFEHLFRSVPVAIFKLVVFLILGVEKDSHGDPNHTQTKEAQKGHLEPENHAAFAVSGIQVVGLLIHDACGFFQIAHGFGSVV